jgi:uncharacterized protein (DUF1015 family)
MAEIRPFRALRYAPARVRLADVVTQPYDKISPAMRREYESRHPNNLVRILLPRAEAADPYAQAAETFREWRRSGIIEQLGEPSLFGYCQRYRVPGTVEARARCGVVALTRLEDYANGIVFPHERTLSGPKRDRLELLRHTLTHFGQVFLLYSDQERTIDALLEKTAPAEGEANVRDEFGVEHSLWPISDPRSIREVQAALEDRKLIIADGHHRYETALAFRDEERRRLGASDAGPCEWLMTTLVNMESPGLTILATHRVVHGLEGFDASRLLERVRAFFHVRSVSGVDELKSRLASGASARATIGVGLKDEIVLLELREEIDLARSIPDLSPLERGLDVVVLHRLILERCLEITDADVRGGRCLRYVRGVEETLAMVETGEAQAGFLLNPTRIEQVRDIAFSGEVLPQKSTDFFPKLLSGMTMYSLGQGE